MDSRIKLIKVDHKESTKNEPIEPPKRRVITQNSPIIKRLREAEEKNKQHRLSDDELIELEFKEEADKIRAARAKNITLHNESIESKGDSHIIERKVESQEISNINYVKLISSAPQTRNSYYESKKSDLNNSDFTAKEISENTPDESPTISINIEKLSPIKEDSIETRVDFKESYTSNLSQHQDDIIQKHRNQKHNNIEIQHIQTKKPDIIVSTPIDVKPDTTLYSKLESTSSKPTLERIPLSRTLDKDTQNTLDSTARIIQRDNTLQDTATQKISPREYYHYTKTAESSVDISVQNANHIDSINIIDLPVDNDSLDSADLSDNVNPTFTLPHTALLNEPIAQQIDMDNGESDMKAHNLLRKLKVFKIDGDIAGIHSGPVVTTFEFRPAASVKVSKILALQDDLSMTLMAKSIRIQAPIPGKDVVGIEIPNNKIQTIYIREVFESKEFSESSAKLAIALGKDVIGRPIVQDLAKLPHLLIAGTTGSGKSVGLNGMILSLLYKNTPNDLRFIMIDPKMVELSLYKDIPHLLTPIISDPKKAIIALSRAVDEMNKRFEMFGEVGVKDIEGYNALEAVEKIPYIVIIIDEFADLMIMGGKDAEKFLISLASKARASGIHLIIATQRPTVDVITGLIKSNLPSRISYRVGSKTDSKVILDENGADSLLGNGDLLFRNTNSIIRIHAPYSHEREIERVADFIRSQQQVEYDDFFSLDRESSVNIAQNTPLSSESDYIQRAKEVILSSQKTSISYLQRSLGIGFNKAAGIIEQLEKEGFLSAQNSKGIREIIG